MYEGYFQLQRRPFSATPDPKCFFPSPEIQEALDELILRVESGQGIGVLTSQAGTGKTLLCRRIATELADRFTPIFLANANFPTRRALLQALLCELQHRYTGMEEQELRLELIGVLKELASRGRSALLIIDEAHLLNDRLLEEVRTLATLTHDDQPLVRLILSGQLALEEKLADAALEALNQRVACHVVLEPLTRAQSRDYVDFRTTWAGGDTSQLFSDDALESIAHACNGLPRCLNQLCDHCLLLAYVAELPQVSREIVSDALADLKQLPLHWNESLPATSPLAALSAVANPSVEVAFDESDTESDADSESDPEHGDHRIAHATEGTAESMIEVGGTYCETPVAEHAIEIGCSESTYDRESWELRDSAARAQDMMHPGARSATGITAPTEETVHDRYAALDSRSWRLAGTFSDQGAIAVSGFGQPTAEPPTRRPEPRPPAHEIANSAARFETNAPREPQPDKLIDQMLPLLAEACAVESTHHMGVDAEIRSDYRQISSDEPALTHDEDLEDRIGSDVLDVCLDVQRSLGNWGDELTTTDTVAYSDSDLTAGELLDSLDHEFDVVEPESEPIPPAPPRNRIPDIAGVDRGTGHRQVPQPRYKRIFSTLRRKMSRQNGQL